MPLLTDFIKEVETHELPVDAVAVYHGQQLEAAYRWSSDVPVNIYSHTKAFMVTAVGAAVDRGLISTETRLTDLLGDELSDGYDKRIDDIRLKHLLTMSSGFGRPQLMNAQRHAAGFNEDYIHYVLRQELWLNPGERFDYSSADSFMAGVMVERAVGRNLLDFMMDTFMTPMGIPRPYWEKDPRGTPFGGGGMHLRTTDMAKLGILYLQRGVWSGERLISERWVDEATSLKIDTHGDNRWSCGYGYKFWLDPMDGCYRADGAYGQITHVLPDKGAVVAYNCHAAGDAMTRIHDAFYDHIYQQL